LPTVGMPLPMSRNWRTPASSMNCTARCRNARLARAISPAAGIIDSSRLAASRSASKLWLPPSRAS
jgi:hypothetical protein